MISPILWPHAFIGWAARNVRSFVRGHACDPLCTEVGASKLRYRFVAMPKSFLADIGNFYSDDLSS
jgi:hypothetical protein